MPFFSQPVLQPGVGRHTTEFFSNANHPVIYGGNFTSVNQSTTQPVKKDGFEILQEHVSAAAFHNSMQRVDPPRCHENTREAVLEELWDWIVGNVPREAWIAWLNGAAGAGKSAICQSTAEMCIKRGVKVASFFFFRTDATRKTVDPVVATLAYQVIQLFPETKPLILRSIELHPLIFKQTFETQLDVLILAPIRHLQISETLVLIIDGVDECTGNKFQTDIIHTFAKLLQHKDLPIIVLFGSRRESQIEMAFNAWSTTDILKQMPLDNNYQAAEDIHRFLVDRFDNIKRTHPLRKHLKPEWPTTENVQEIINKSSGQFVYASVVIKFVSVPSSSPSTQLEIVHGLRPAGRATPFAELDALYRHIFLQVEDITTTLMILSFRLLGNYQPQNLRNIAHFFNITYEDVESILAGLTSVLSCDTDNGGIEFYHASLSDFLRDKQRSREFCISEMGTDLSILWFKNAASNRFDTPGKVSEENQMNLVYFLLHAKATPELHELMLKYTPLKFHYQHYNSHFWTSKILDRVQKMDFGDNGEVYRTLSKRMDRYVEEIYPEYQGRMENHVQEPRRKNIQTQLAATTKKVSSTLSKLIAQLRRP